MADGFLDYWHARVVEHDDAKAEAILAKRFEGHEEGLAMYKQALDSAEQIWHNTKPALEPDILSELAKPSRSDA